MVNVEIVNNAQAAGLEVTMTASPNPVAGGQAITYTATVTNNTSSSATDALLEFDIDDTFEDFIQSISSSGVQGTVDDALNASMPLGTVAPNSSVTVTIVVQTVAGQHSFVATSLVSPAADSNYFANVQTTVN